MRTRYFSEDDGWSLDGPSITAVEHLDLIKDVLEKRGSIIVEHWYYRGASSPSRRIFDSIDEFTDYLENDCFAGDLLDIWCMHELCNRENVLLSAKCPDENGRVPSRGSY
ncbi:MAG TPA: hypothetical protein DDW52_11600 [Planctomycetaceae bacterium]|nr:hypothetical protein [Planctomycetaceae bacterium]